MSNCIFCEIAAGKAQAAIVSRDELTTAFMDIQPINPGHVLIVPNAHAARLAELPEETGAQIFRSAQRVAAALLASGLRCEGVNFFLADGEAAMQEVFHVHLHVFPRFRGDGFALEFAERYYTKPPLSEIESAAEEIRKQVERLRAGARS